MKRTLFVFLALLFLASCGGGGSSNSGEVQPPVQQEPPPESVSTGQALLGPIVDANVVVYEVSALDGANLCEGTTKNDSDLELAGRIEIPGSCIADEGLYLLVARGGADIDADDDGVLDEDPTPLLGSVHALLTSQQIRSSDFKLSAMSEIVFQQLKYDLSVSNVDRAQVLSRIDRLAKVLIRSDINSDGTIDHIDLGQWHARDNAADFRRQGNQLTKLLSETHRGENSILTSAALTSASLLDERSYDFVFDLILENDLVFFGHSGGLEIVSINTNFELEKISTLKLPGQAITALAKQSDTIFAVTEDGLLNIVDVSDPQSPKVVISIPVAGRITDIVLNGDLAYLAANNEGVTVFDISQSEAPALVTVVSTNDSAHKLSLSDRLYVADQSGGLLIFDLTDPALPLLVGTLIVDEPVQHVTVRGDRAYFSASSSWYVSNVTNPDAPELLSALTLGFAVAGQTQLEGTIAFVADLFSSTLHRIDISDELDPVRLDSPVISALTNFKLKDGFAYATTFFGLSIVDTLAVLSDSDNLLIPSDTAFDYQDIEAANDTVYAFGQSDLISVRTQGDEFFKERTSIEGCRDNSSLDDLVVSGQFGYIAGGDCSELVLVDLASMSSPTILDRLPITGQVEHMAAGEFGVVYSVTNASVGQAASSSIFFVSTDKAGALIPSGMYQYPQGLIHDIVIDGPLAYVIVGTSPNTQIDTFNLADTVSKTPIRQANFGGDRRFAINGELLMSYGGRSITLYQIDASTGTPTAISTITLPTVARRLVADANYIYALDHEGLLTIVDVSDATNPSLFAFFGTSNGLDIALGSDQIYLSGSSNLLVIGKPQRNLP